MGQKMGPAGKVSHGMCADCAALSEDDRAWELGKYGRCLTLAERKASDEADRILPGDPLASVKYLKATLDLVEKAMKPKASKWPDPAVYLFECLDCGAMFDSKWHWNEKDPCVVTCPCGARMATDNDSEGPYVTELVSTPEHGETCPCPSCRKEMEEANRE
jgi:hypothetical protein